MAYNGGIGNKGDLLYHIPEDLKRFKKLTTDHTVIMGRKTFESLPNGPLPDRRNIVLSNTLKERAGIEVFPTLNAALETCEGEDEVFVIGGARVYDEAAEFADKLYVTMVDDRENPKEADTFLSESLIERFGGRTRILKEGEKINSKDMDVFFCCLNVFI